MNATQRITGRILVTVFCALLVCFLSSQAQAKTFPRPNPTRDLLYFGGRFLGFLSTCLRHAEGIPMVLGSIDLNGIQLSRTSCEPATYRFSRIWWNREHAGGNRYDDRSSGCSFLV